MDKITKKKNVKVCVEQDVTMYKTSDGREFEEKKDALTHEELMRRYSKFSKNDIEWLEGLIDGDNHGNCTLEQFEKDLKAGKALLLLSNSDEGCFGFEAVEPVLVAVMAVIKALHRKTIGCGCNQYVDSIIYKSESFCFEKDPVYGRNIAEVLK
jgi:hypothetical protein